MILGKINFKRTRILVHKDEIFVLKVFTVPNWKCYENTPRAEFATADRQLRSYFSKETNTFSFNKFTFSNEIEINN